MLWWHQNKKIAISVSSSCSTQSSSQIGNVPIRISCYGPTSTMLSNGPNRISCNACIRFSDGHTMPTSGLMPDSQSTLDHFKSGFLMAPPGSNYITHQVLRWAVHTLRWHLSISQWALWSGSELSKCSTRLSDGPGSQMAQVFRWPCYTTAIISEGFQM